MKDLKKWRTTRIEGGDCNYDDMVALNNFIESAKIIDMPVCEACGYKKFTNEVIEYIFYVMDIEEHEICAETICRKLYKHGLIEHKNGYWSPKEDFCIDK